MGVIRTQNWLPQQRVDLPHLRAIESSIENDWDIFAGKMISGKQPLILKGFNITTSNTLGNPASNLVLNVAGGLLLHFGASDSGTIFSVTDTQAAETLVSTNAKVAGSFVAGVTNYIGLDLVRTADTSTSDLVKFNNILSNQETSQIVPLARIFNYRIVISTQNFASSTNILPIAIVATDSSNNVQSITDARKMMFRLGSGGDNPDSNSTFSWGTRTENPVTYTGGADPFTAEDKSINSLKQWIDAISTRIWELGGGEHWYSPTSDRDVKVAYGQPVLSINSDNFYFDGTSLSWSGLSVVFSNSTAISNTINSSQTTFAGPVAFPDQSGLYVDVKRDTDGAVLNAVVAPLSTLGYPLFPGSRLIIAWRKGSYVYTRDRGYEVGRTLVPVNVPNGVVGLDGSENAVIAGNLTAANLITSGYLQFSDGSQNTTAAPVIQTGTAQHKGNVTFSTPFASIPAVVIFGGIQYQPGSKWSTDDSTNYTLAPLSDAQYDEVAALSLTSTGFTVRARLKQKGSGTITAESIGSPHTMVSGNITLPGDPSTVNGTTGGTSVSNAITPVPSVSDSYTVHFSGSLTVNAGSNLGGEPQASASSTLTIAIDASTNGTTWNNGITSKTYTASVTTTNGGTNTVNISEAIAITVPSMTTSGLIRIRVTAFSGTHGGDSTAGTANYSVSLPSTSSVTYNYSSSTTDQYASKTPDAEDTVSWIAIGHV